MDRTVPTPSSRSTRTPTPGDTPRSLADGAGSDAAPQWLDDALAIWLRPEEQVGQDAVARTRAHPDAPYTAR